MHYLFLFLALFAHSSTSLINWKEDRVVAEGRGIKGPWRQNDSNYHYVDDPTIALDKEGEIHIGWVDQTKKDVLFQRLSKEDLKPVSKPINVSNNSDTFSWLPKMAIAPDDPNHIYIFWQEIIFSGGSHGGEALFAQSKDGGKSFSDPINLSKSKAGDGKGRITQKIWDNGSLDVIAGADGKVIVAWSEFEGALWVATSDDFGKTFSKPKIVAGGPGKLPVRAPSLSSGEENDVFLAWTNGDNPSADIHIQKSNDGGKNFSDPEVVKKTKGFSDAPKVAVDSEGVIHLVYSESEESMLGRFGKFDITYTKFKDEGKTFEETKIISSPVPESIESSRYPYLSIGADNHIYALWEVFPNARSYPQGLGLSVSLDSGEKFSNPEIVPGSVPPENATNGSQQGLLMDKIAVDKHGNIFIVNSSLRRKHNSQVWIMKGKQTSD